MNRLSFLALGLCLTGVALGARPLATVPKFSGTFAWIKLEPIPSKTFSSKDRSILVDITFPKDVRLKKDAKGYQWFTFALADQGGDWKWYQAKGNTPVPNRGGTIKAGKVTISMSLAGIPKSALDDPKQTLSLGPSASGLVSPAAFTVDRIRTH